MVVPVAAADEVLLVAVAHLAVVDVEVAAEDLARRADKRSSS